MINRKYFILIYFALFLLNACKDKEKTTEILPEEVVVLAPQTKVLNIQQTNLLSAIEADKLVFNGNVTDYNVGNILVSDMNTKVPDGFLRKVTSIQQNAGLTTVNTQDVSITEAIKKAKTSFTKIFDAKDIVVLDTSGVEITGKPAQKTDKNGTTFKFNFKKIVWDKDNNKNTKYNQVEVEGGIDISPTFSFDLGISNYELTKLLFKTNVNNKSTIKVYWGMGVNSSEYVPKQFVLATFQLPPFTIPVGGFPLPIARNWIVIVCGIDGSINVELTAETTNEHNSEAGILYENKQWNYIKSQANKFTPKIPKIEGTAIIEPWIETRYEARPFGLSSSRLSLGVRGGLEIKGETSTNGIDYNLDWKTKLSAKAQLRIFSNILADINHTFFEAKYPITSGTILFNYLVNENFDSVSSLNNWTTSIYPNTLHGMSNIENGSLKIATNGEGIYQPSETICRANYPAIGTNLSNYEISFNLSEIFRKSYSNYYVSSIFMLYGEGGQGGRGTQGLHVCLSGNNTNVFLDIYLINPPANPIHGGAGMGKRIELNGNEYHNYDFKCVSVGGFWQVQYKKNSEHTYNIYNTNITAMDNLQFYFRSVSYVELNTVNNGKGIFSVDYFRVRKRN